MTKSEECSRSGDSLPVGWPFLAVQRRVAYRTSVRSLESLHGRCGHYGTGRNAHPTARRNPNLTPTRNPQAPIRNEITSRIRIALVTLAAVFGFVASSHAQWLSQSVTLKPGWNAVYLHVDATHTTLQDEVAPDVNNPISEIWLWQPSPGTLQFVDDPQVPVGTGTQWASWVRATGGSSVLQRLIGNGAYLVNNGGTENYTWTIKGRPVPPANTWTSTGLNFIGFPTPAATPPLFANFLAPAPNLGTAEIYHYVGGPLSATNPRRLFTLNTTPVTRGEAFWVRAGNKFNRYFGPFELVSPNGRGADFGDSTAQLSFRLRNLTDTARTVTLNLLASEAAPIGEAAIAGNVPVLVRGALNTSTLTYNYADLSSAQQWTLQPKGQVGSEVEVVIGVNRSALTGNAGDLFAGVLRFTDDAGLQQADVPVSAVKASAAGLWVGAAEVTDVRAFLKSFQKDETGALVTVTDPQAANYGSYVTTSINTDLGKVARPFSMRLIVHADATGNARLMQRIYYGLRQNVIVLATKQDYLDQDQLAVARRISAVQLPYTKDNAGWSFTGGILAQGNTLSAAVPLAYDDRASNPFIHAYHPDHDNLNAVFATKLPAANESYNINRTISLQTLAPGDDFASLTTGSKTLSGNYAEQITLVGAAGGRTYEVAGTFLLRRINNIATLTTE